MEKDGDLTPEEFSKSADALKLTAQDLLGFKIIDGIIPERLAAPTETRKQLQKIFLR